MNLGKYEIETYFVVVNGQTETRERVIYTGINEEDLFIERYYGVIRDGYRGSNTFFKNLTWSNIKSHIVGESIVINDNSLPPKPQIYLNISSIESIQREGDVKITIIDTQINPITLEFVTTFDSDQAYSLFNLMLKSPDVDLDLLIVDITPPIIFFNEYFFSNLIKIDGSDLNGPFSTDDSQTFRIDIDFNTFEGPNPITKNDILIGLIYDVTDNRDGDINITEDDISIYKDVISPNNSISEISEPGLYLCKFHLHDLGQNQNNSTIIFSIV